MSATSSPLAETCIPAGTVQAYGMVLVLDPTSLTVCQASGNAQDFIGFAAKAVVGLPLAEVIGRDAAASLRAALDEAPEASQPCLERPSLKRLIAIGESELHVTLHRHDGAVLLEAERPAPPARNAGSYERRVADFTLAVAKVDNGFLLARLTAEALAEITCYDRVMIYRFLPDWSGEVTAEVRNGAGSSYLGLRFPHTCFPEHSRDYYRRYDLRLIANVDGEPVPLLPARHPDTDTGTDLGPLLLRSGCAANIHNMRAMGVSATLHAALRTGGRLWGLAVCHHSSPRLPTLRERLAVTTITKAASSALERIELADLLETERQVARRLAGLERSVASSDNIIRALIDGDPGLLDLVSADGLAIRHGRSVVSCGLTPDPEWLPRLFDAIETQAEQGVVAIECLANLDPAAAEFRETASGMLATFINYDPPVVVAAFRREVVHEVLWGGDANATPGESSRLRSVDKAGAPARSFAQWRETVTGRCRPWEPEALVAWGSLPTWLASAHGGYDQLVALLGSDIEVMTFPEVFNDLLAHVLLNTINGPALIAGLRGDAAFAPTELRVRTTNRAFRQLFKIDAETVAGLPLAEALNRVGLDGSRLVAGQSGQEESVTLIAAGAGERTLTISQRWLFRLTTPDRQEACSLWLFDDTTRCRRVELALRTARDHAEASSRAKTEFLANMSHEMRTPLNAIIGFSEIMCAELFGSMSSPKYKEYVRHIHSAGEHLLKVIGDILDISKIEAERYVLEEQTINLPDTIDTICALMHEEAGRNGLRLMEEISSQSLYLQADDRALKQILLNLLSNSIKFTPAGGVVICRAMALDSGAIAIEVQDTGIGIPEEYLQRVLDPFIQVHSTQTRRVGGTGLGLSLVRALAHLHDAVVTLNSHPGKGTVVRITFPPWRMVPEEAWLDRMLGNTG
ncbi:two-component system, chemotaxis family, sensor kinase Cph1 [uncultured Gammaproteobacteria bacterium]